MARQIVNIEKLAEAQEAADRAMEAATEAAEKVAEAMAVVAADAQPAAKVDTRMVTSLRLAPELLAALKVLAVRERARVNDIIVEAIRNHLALKGQAI